MAEIKLTNSDQPALVDDADFEWINKFEWQMENGYATTTIAGHRVEMGTLVYVMHHSIIPMTRNLWVSKGFARPKGKGARWVN